MKASVQWRMLVRVVYLNLSADCVGILVVTKCAYSQHGDIHRSLHPLAPDGTLLILDRVWQVLTNFWNILSHKLKLRVNNISAASFCTRVWPFSLNSVQYGSTECVLVKSSESRYSTSAYFGNNADIILGTRNRWTTRECGLWQWIRMLDAVLLWTGPFVCPWQTR